MRTSAPISARFDSYEWDERRGFQSAKGAQCDSLGQRPRFRAIHGREALKARNRPINQLLPAFSYYPLSAITRFQRLQQFGISGPRALPWAVTSRAFGAAI